MFGMQQGEFFLVYNIEREGGRFVWWEGCGCGRRRRRPLSPTSGWCLDSFTTIAVSARDEVSAGGHFGDEVAVRVGGLRLRVSC
jgi:hypothetical protein